MQQISRALDIDADRLAFVNKSQILMITYLSLSRAVSVAGADEYCTFFLLLNCFVQLTASNGARVGVQDVVVLVSTGNSRVPEGSLASASAAQQLKSAGVTVYSVAVGDFPNIAELNAISSDSSHVLSINSTSSYANTASRLLDVLC